MRIVSYRVTNYFSQTSSSQVERQAIYLSKSPAICVIFKTLTNISQNFSYWLSRLLKRTQLLNLIAHRIRGSLSVGD